MQLRDIVQIEPATNTYLYNSRPEPRRCYVYFWYNVGKCMSSILNLLKNTKE